MKQNTIYKQIGLAFLASFVMTACDYNGANATSETIAHNNIVTYAKNGKIIPTQQDYADIGVKGIDNEESLAEINEIVEGSEVNEVDTTEEIQDLVNAFRVKAKDVNASASTVKLASSTCPTSACGSTCNSSASTCSTATR